MSDSVVSEQAAVAPRALPDPAIPPEDLQAVMPGLSLEDATRYCSLATLAVSAAIWPKVIPNPPNPPAPMYAALLSVATRFATVGEASGDSVSGMPVVSESIGSYSYRLQSPPTLDSILALTDAERNLLAPWLAPSAYMLDLAPNPWVGWPIDWWQRDYDNLVALADGAV